MRTSKMRKKSLNSPDETRIFDKGKVILRNNGVYLEPGWIWDKCVKPIAKTKSCMVAIHYLSYQEKVSQDRWCKWRRTL